MKINRILLIAFISIAVVGSLLGSTFYFLNSSEIIKNNTYQYMESVAESRANHIETYLLQNIERLELITSNTRLRATLKKYNETPSKELKNEMTRIINDAKEPIEEFERICVIGLDGVIITSTNEAYCGKDIYKKDFFKTGLKESKIWFVDEDNEKKIFVSSPFILDNETLGVAVTVVNIDYLGKIVKDRTGFAETGEVLVTIRGENERIYLFKRLFEEEALQQSIESDETAEPMKQALAGNERLFENTLDYRNKEVIAVSQFIETGKIGLVAKIDRPEAIGIAERKLMETTLLVFVVTAILGSLFGLIASRIISKPITKLTSDVREITKGKLDIQLEKSNISEIQILTESLNRILASMKLAILRTEMSQTDLGIGEALEAKEKAEEKLKEIELKYKALYETSIDAIMLVSPKEGFIAGNPATIKMFGCKNEKQFIKQNPGSLSSKKQPDGTSSNKKSMEEMKKALKNGSNQFEWIHKKLSGEEFPATVQLTKMRLSGKIVLQAIVQDVSRKKAIEQRVVENLEKYKAVFTASPLAIVLVTKDGTILETNNRLTEWLGFKPSEVNGKNILKVNFITKKSKLIVAKNFAVRMLGKKIEPYEIEFKTKNGKKKIGKIFASPIKDKKGNATHDLIMIQNMEKEANK